MGAPIVSLCTGSRDPDDMWRFHPENAGREAWSDLLSELEVALAYAGEVGVLLAIEPEPANVVCDAKAAKKLLGELSSPHLGIILDAANLLSAATLARQHEVMAEATDLLGGSLLLAHAKDIDASGNVVSPGDGAVDLIAFARGLRSAGYDGALVAHGFRAEQSAAAWRAIDLVLRGSA
jgi:sugar phosphate isomerase/epimerase